MKQQGLMPPKEQGPVAPETGYQGAPEGQPNVTPEEQQLYDQIVDNAYQIIYDPKTTDNLLSRITQSGNPIEGLASVAFMVVSTLEESAKKAGQPIPQDVLFHAGTEILEELADLALEEGVHDFKEEEIEGAFFSAMDMYGAQAEKNGTGDKEAAKAEFAAIEQADKDGTLVQKIPQLGGQ